MRAPCASPFQPNPRQSPSPALIPHPSSPHHQQAGPSHTHPPCAAHPSATRAPSRPLPCRPASPPRCPHWLPAPPWSRPLASHRGPQPLPSVPSTHWSPPRRPSSGFRPGLHHTMHPATQPSAGVQVDTRRGAHRTMQTHSLMLTALQLHPAPLSG
uniref:Uncharacterized protein n=1 Tax=Anas platyrhynchos platyrhynchos TaxID=8840 RepID=A0A493T252_ANAPP